MASPEDKFFKPKKGVKPSTFSQHIPGLAHICSRKHSNVHFVYDVRPGAPQVNPIYITRRVYNKAGSFKHISITDPVTKTIVHRCPTLREALLWAREHFPKLEIA